MASYTVTTTPRQERTLAWLTRRFGASAAAVIQRIADDALDVYIRERGDVLGSRMLAEYDKASPDIKAQIRALITFEE